MTIKVKRSDYPDGETRATVVGRIIVFVTTSVDDMAGDNPLDNYDEMGEIYGLGRHGHDRSVLTNHAAAVQELNTNPDAVPLADSGGNSANWRIKGRTERPDGVWIPCKGLIGYANDAGEAAGSPARISRMRDYAIQACTLFNQWANGDVFHYSVEAYRVRRVGTHVYEELADYRFDDPLDEDSCGGFYGEEALHEALDAVLECTLKTARKALRKGTAANA